MEEGGVGAKINFGSSAFHFKERRENKPLRGAGGLMMGVSNEFESSSTIDAFCVEGKSTRGISEEGCH